MEPDQTTIVVLKQTLTGIAMSLGELPLPTLENFDEWKSKAPLIIQTAQSVALAFQERAPSVARIFDQVAAECDVIIVAIERDRDEPASADRIAAREKQISELQGRVLQAAQSL